jgi:hypothetical protein
MSLSTQDMSVFRTLLENSTIQGNNVNVSATAPAQSRGVLAQPEPVGVNPYDMNQMASVDGSTLPEVAVKAPQLSSSMQAHFDKLTGMLAKATAPQDIVKILNNPNVQKILENYVSMYKKSNPEVKITSTAPAQSRGVLAQEMKPADPYGLAQQNAQAPAQAPAAAAAPATQPSAQAPAAPVQAPQGATQAQAPATQKRGVLATPAPQGANPYENDPKFQKTVANAEKVLEQYAKQ